MPTLPDVMILCGGLGTRFRAVTTDIPKVLAPVGGIPILDRIIDFFSQSGYRRVILCTGYMSDAVRKHYHGSPYASSIVISEEPEPRGTAGAVKYAEAHITTDPFFVVNGDSYCDLDLSSFLAFHQAKPDGLVSMAVSRRDERSDTGTVNLDEASSKVMGFYEKQQAERGRYMNAGYYIFNRRVLSHIPESQVVSLEYDLFSELAGKGLYGFVTSSRSIDIGTPERYEEASRVLSE